MPSLAAKNAKTCLMKCCSSGCVGWEDKQNIASFFFYACPQEFLISSDWGKTENFFFSCSIPLVFPSQPDPLTGQLLQLSRKKLELEVGWRQTLECNFSIHSGAKNVNTKNYGFVGVSGYIPLFNQA